MERSVEVRVPSNIALIKYWGKRDENLILPLNDSVSLTIDCLCATTRVTCVEGSRPDTVSINGTAVDLTKSKRFARCFDEARRLQRKSRTKSSADVPCYSFQVESTTNFPVAAGLASSAAGFAAIAVALGHLFEFSPSDVSRIARIGSGSACRSVFGGLVHWYAGQDTAGTDCFSESIFPSSHWPDLRAVIIVLSEAEKQTGSTVGMQTTVQTSRLLEHRVDVVVPERVKSLITAFKDRDFPALAETIMADSNTFHAVCMDTRPPLRYMTDYSWSVVHLVNTFNSKGIRAAYSFDAGPNACVFLPKENLDDFLLSLSESFVLPSHLVSELNIPAGSNKDSRGPQVHNVIVSNVGGEPQIMK